MNENCPKKSFAFTDISEKYIAISESKDASWARVIEMKLILVGWFGTQKYDGKFLRELSTKVFASRHCIDKDLVAKANLIFRGWLNGKFVFCVSIHSLPLHANINIDLGQSSLYESEKV